MYPPNYLLKNRKVIIYIAIVISLVGGFVPIGRVLSIQRTFALFPFFVMGYYSVDYDIRNIINRIPLPVALSVIFLTFISLFLYFNKDITRFLVNTDPYSSTALLNRCPA